MKVRYRPGPADPAQDGLGWRRRATFALLGLRPPAADHTAADAAALQALARSRRSVVELGVAEGASAAALRAGMPADGVLWCVDPYDQGRYLGRSAVELVAHRLVGSAGAAEVRWVRARSDDAAVGWTTPIDLLLVDAVHRYDAIRDDWAAWSPHVVPGGDVVVRPRPAGPAGTMPDWLDEQPGWARHQDLDDFVVFRRTSS